MQNEKPLTIRFRNGPEVQVPLAIRRIHTGRDQRATKNPHYSNGTPLTDSSRYFSEQHTVTQNVVGPMNGETAPFSSSP
jgi:hypothetical protein